MANTLNGRDEVKTLVDRFYQKVDMDDLLSPVFNEVAQINWEHHLPKMYDFWETVLFGAQKFKGNPMDTHIKLSRKTRLTQAHFDRWLELFYTTVNENFTGEKAEEAKIRARSIAGIMQHKINEQSLKAQG